MVGRPNIGYIVVNDCWVFEEGHELGFVVDSENFLIKRHFDHHDVKGAGLDLHQPYAHDITGVEAFICVGRLPEPGVSERGVVDQCDVRGQDEAFLLRNNDGGVGACRDRQHGYLGDCR